MADALVMRVRSRAWRVVRSIRGSLVAPEEGAQGLDRSRCCPGEKRHAEAGAKKIYVDTLIRTAMREREASISALACDEDARLPDFYGPGDAKVIYVKQLSPSP